MKLTSYPALYNYVAFKVMLRHLGINFEKPPLFDEETFRFGHANSPEYSCMPYKVYLGLFKKAAESGFDGIFVYGTRDIRACRYVELFTGMERKLRKLGFNFTVHLWGGYGAVDSLKRLSKLAGASYFKTIYATMLFMKVISASDKINSLANKMRPREKNSGKIDKWLDRWQNKLMDVRKIREADKLYKAAVDELLGIEVNTKKKIKRVAVVGDLFKIHESYMHFDTIRRLAKLGVEAKQSQPFSILFYGISKIPSKKFKQFKYYQELSKPYLKSVPCSYIDVGLGEVISQLKDGVKGVVHFQTFGCMPDIMMRPILDKIAKDYKVPIMHFMRDVETQDSQYQTRLEAFVEMLK